MVREQPRPGTGIYCNSHCPLPGKEMQVLAVGWETVFLCTVSTDCLTMRMGRDFRQQRAKW